MNSGDFNLEGLHLDDSYFSMKLDDTDLQQLVDQVGSFMADQAETATELYHTQYASLLLASNQMLEDIQDGRSKEQKNGQS